MREIAAISLETTAALKVHGGHAAEYCCRALANAGDMVQQEPEQVALCQSAKAVKDVVNLHALPDG